MNILPGCFVLKFSFTTKQQHLSLITTRIMIIVNVRPIPFLSHGMYCIYILYSVHDECGNGSNSYYAWCSLI